MKATHNQRSWKNYLPHRNVQLPIIAANLIFLCIVCTILILVLLSPLYHDMLNADDLWVQHVSGNLFIILLQRLALAMLLILLLAAVYQILLSHRFFGPLVNFGHTFAKMAEGDFSRKVHLRKKDFLKTEAVQVNAIIDRLNHDAAILNEKVDRMSESLALLSRQESAADRVELIETLQQSVNGCREVVSAWSSPPIKESQEPT